MTGAGDDHEEHDAEFGLVMPFVVCESQGGPYDDNAYVAGFEAGNLAMNLVLNRAPFNATVHTENPRNEGGRNDG